jgi:hypothetical protein
LTGGPDAGGAPRTISGAFATIYRAQDGGDVSMPFNNTGQETKVVAAWVLIDGGYKKIRGGGWRRGRRSSVHHRRRARGQLLSGRRPRHRAWPQHTTGVRGLVRSLHHRHARPRFARGRKTGFDLACFGGCGRHLGEQEVLLRRSPRRLKGDVVYVYQLSASDAGTGASAGSVRVASRVARIDNLTLVDGSTTNQFLGAQSQEVRGFVLDADYKLPQPGTSATVDTLNVSTNPRS